MAWSILDAPGTPDGPCKEPCRHLDCQANRRLAETTCRLCAKPIGYDAKFCNDPWRLGAEIHFSCMLAESEKRKSEGRR